MKKLDPKQHAGCWIDGHWGQYAIARMVSLAEENGYRDEKLCSLAYRHLAQATTIDAQPLDDDEWEQLIDSADSVEQWMNDNLAPEGFLFVWIDGEFFLTDDVALWSED